MWAALPAGRAMQPTSSALKRSLVGGSTAPAQHTASAHPTNTVPFFVSSTTTSPGRNPRATIGPAAA
jgi:hypothetical protein